MLLRRLLPGLLIILAMLFAYTQFADGAQTACQYDYEGDGDIDGLDIIRFISEFDGLDLDYFAALFGSTNCRPIVGLPPDLDMGISFDEQQGGGGLVGETVRLLNGNAFVPRTDLSFVSAHSLGLSFSAYYNSQSPAAGSPGYGWRHTYSVLLDPAFNFSSQTYIRIVDETGRGHYFLEESAAVFKGTFNERSHVTAEPHGFSWHRLNGHRYGFSNVGRLLWIDDEKGNRLELVYDGQQRLSTVTDQASGRALTFNYNEIDLIESIDGPVTEAVADGIWVVFGYDANQNLSSVTYKDGTGFDYTYADPQDIHNLTAAHNKAGHLINTWSCDDQDRCIDNFSPTGKGVAVNYVSDNQVKVTDAYDVERTYAIRVIDGRRRLAAMQGLADPPYSETKITRWEYDDKMQLVRVTLENGTVHRYENFDDRGNPQTVILASGTPWQRTLYFTYHPRTNTFLSRSEISILGVGSKLTTLDYDDDGDDAPNENPTGLLYRIIEQGFTRNPTGNIVSYEYITRFTYNNRGQVLTVDGPLPGSDDTTEFAYYPVTGDFYTITRPLVGVTQFMDYDAAGQPGKVIDVNGQSTRFGYDGRGRVVATYFDADHSTAGMTYNTAGLIDTTTDEDDVYTNYEYYPDFARLHRIYDFDNNYIHHEYDSRGNLIERSRHNPADDRFSRNRWSYDGPDIPGKLHRAINFDDTFTEYRYDSGGNLASMIDPELNVTEYRYDAFNRLIDVIQTMDSPGDVVTSYDYDIHGNLRSVTDAENHQTIYEYDDMGRVVATLSPDTGTTSYTYDEAGNMISKTDANGITTIYSYDNLKRLTAVQFPDNAQNITYSYDEGQFGKGRRTGMTDPSGTTTFGYSKRGRLISKISTINNIAYPLSRSHTPGGRLSSMTYPSGRSLDFTRYNSGKVKDVATTSNAQTTTLFSNMAYNPFGRPSGMNTGYGGTVNNQTTECACLDVSNPGQPMEQQYIYDGNRNLISITGTNIPWFNQDFEYDSLGRLTHAIGKYGTISYTYDKVGNRLTRNIDGQAETYNYYPGTNRLKEVIGTQTISYSNDSNGNTIVMGDKTLTYNQNNRLVQVKKGTDIIGEYVYNGLGQRATKSAEGVTTVFLYDFDGNIIAEGQPDGTITSDYLYIFSNRIAMVDVETGSFYYYLNNYLGTPILMTNEKGDVVWEGSYRPFGDTSVISIPGVVNNFRLAGQYYDQETGMHYNYHRYYYPDLGIYLTPDPIGLMGGNNLYLYLGGNPINWIDPYGLLNPRWSSIITGGGAIIFGSIMVYSGATISATGIGALIGVPMVVGGAASLGWGVTEFLAGWMGHETGVATPNTAAMVTLVATGDMECAKDAALMQSVVFSAALPTAQMYTSIVGVGANVPTQVKIAEVVGANAYTAFEALNR